MSPTSRHDERTGFGTFGGVFTPCTLTILGVIMFLRFGYVVGRAGIYCAVAIVLASKAITILTGLSLSAISTNTRVQGGGAYFLISRSLGVEYGGAIGIVFFAAQAISVAMYAIGFSEAFVTTFPSLGLSIAAAATIVNVAVFACVAIGAGWTIKIQYGILATLAAALVSFYVGAAGSFDVAILKDGLAPRFIEGEDFLVMFALFFPAVTGIMAGANMSGDLRDPARSIPRGTLWAIAVTGIVYLSLAILLGAVRRTDELVGDPLVIRRIAAWPVLITAGVFAATLSSALGSMMGAPRILQALARDRVFQPLSPFAAGSGSSQEPRRATAMTFAISQAAILLGDLNAIAPIITMAFMITYGTLNLATFYESQSGNPSYRPRFRHAHWSASLAGAIGCLVVMVLISPVAAVVSIVLMYGLYRHIGRREIEARWGDLQRGLLFERTRRYLLRLEAELHHPKNWRPVVLAFSGGGWSRPHLAIHGHWLTASHGILSLGQVIAGEVEDRLERRRNQEQILSRFIDDEGLEAFPAVVVGRTIPDGIASLVQSHGLGSLRPNTILFGWPVDRERAESFGSLVRQVVGLDRSVIALRMPDLEGDPRRVPAGPIDVWWRGEANGALMLLLAHLLTRDPGWRDHPIRLLRVVAAREARPTVIEHLEGLIEGARIPAEPIVVVNDDVPAAIRTTSGGASIVFIGFEPPVDGDEKGFHDRMEALAGRLDRVAFVRSVGGMSLET